MVLTAKAIGFNVLRGQNHWFYVCIARTVAGPRRVGFSSFVLVVCVWSPRLFYPSADVSSRSVGSACASCPNAQRVPEGALYWQYTRKILERKSPNQWLKTNGFCLRTQTNGFRQMTIFPGKFGSNGLKPMVGNHWLDNFA